MISTALVLAIALVTLYVVRSIRTFLALRHFGGHWSVGWTRLWLLRTQGSGEMNKRFTKVNNKYGEYDFQVSGTSICQKFADLVASVALVTLVLPQYELGGVFS